MYLRGPTSEGREGKEGGDGKRVKKGRRGRRKGMGGRGQPPKMFWSGTAPVAYTLACINPVMTESES